VNNILLPATQSNNQLAITTAMSPTFPATVLAMMGRYGVVTFEALVVLAPGGTALPRIQFEVATRQFV